MISVEDLNRCIDKLATINARTDDSTIKQLTIEIGYVLKEEFDILKEWNSQFGNKEVPNIDVKKLIQDNSQLVLENSKLHKINLQLKQMVDAKLPHFEDMFNNINKKISGISEIINA